MKDTVLVYDDRLNAFRELNKHNYNDDWVIGALFFSRDALAILEQDFTVCGYILLGKDGVSDYPIDIQEDKIVMLEGTYNCLPKMLKKELAEYNIREVPKHIWSRFFIQWQFMADLNCFSDNGPFYELCEKLLNDNAITDRMREKELSIIAPQTYLELCEFTKNSIALSGIDMMDLDYAESFKYLIDSLINGYHINFSSDDVETYMHQISLIVNKHLEGKND